jgi:endonuclease YncB( thermonuclease family)
VTDLWTYRARPTRVVDGDTLYVEVDHGMHIFSVQSLRLSGVNAPELYRGTDEEKAAGQAAKQFVQDWIANLPEHKWPLVVRTDKDRRSFNRYVATVTDLAGHDLAAAIIAAGHGEPA